MRKNYFFYQKRLSFLIEKTIFSLRPHRRPQIRALPILCRPRLALSALIRRLYRSAVKLTVLHNQINFSKAYNKAALTLLIPFRLINHFYGLFLSYTFPLVLPMQDLSQSIYDSQDAVDLKNQTYLSLVNTLICI